MRTDCPCVLGSITNSAAKREMQEGEGERRVVLVDVKQSTPWLGVYEDGDKWSLGSRGW